MRIKNVYWLELYLHNTGQIFLPNSNRQYGSVKKIYDGLTGRGHNQRQTLLEIKKAEERSIDKPAERCKEPTKDEEAAGIRYGLATSCILKSYNYCNPQARLDQMHYRVRREGSWLQV